MNSQRAGQRHVEIAVAVVEHEGSVLIGERPAHVALGGYWEFPGGKLEPDESPDAAAIRECLEEAGLEIRITGSYSTVEHEYDHGAARIHFLAAIAVAQREPLPERFRWVSRNELMNYSFPAANRDVLALLTSESTM